MADAPNEGTGLGGGGEERSTMRLVGQVAGDAGALIKKEVELARQEVLEAVMARVKAIAGFAVISVIGLFIVGFLGAAGAAALARVLPTWLALLIVTLVLFAAAGLLVVVGLGRIKRGTPPVPQQAIGEAKATAGALRSNGNA